MIIIIIIHPVHSNRSNSNRAIWSLFVDSDKDSGSGDAVEMQLGSVEYGCRLLTLDFHNTLFTICCIFLVLFCAAPIHGGAENETIGRCDSKVVLLPIYLPNAINFQNSLIVKPSKSRDPTHHMLNVSPHYLVK